MAKPRVFVSSTYYDLKHVRASVEVFVESLGFEPILAEYGSVAFDPSQPLDESCYREAQSSDIFVLIIGGRYGSVVSSQVASAKQREEELESITRREFSKAHDADIPVFVLIEQGVHSEYQTYLRNKDNAAIQYAHVDSVKIFRFIEFVYSKQKNNPVHPFEKGLDIESWLREQWAGIFQDLLKQRKDNERFSDLAAQIRQLEAINTTLKSYLETVLKSVSPDNSSEIIEKENMSLVRSRRLEEARRNSWFNHVRIHTGLSPEEIVDLHLGIDTVGDVVTIFSDKLIDPNVFVKVMDPLDDFEEARRDFNRFRKIIGQSNIRFTKRFMSELESALNAKRHDRNYDDFTVSDLSDSKESSSLDADDESDADDEL